MGLHQESGPIWGGRAVTEIGRAPWTEQMGPQEERSGSLERRRFLLDDVLRPLRRAMQPEQAPPQPARAATRPLPRSKEDKPTKARREDLEHDVPISIRRNLAATSSDPTLTRMAEESPKSSSLPHGKGT